MALPRTYTGENCAVARSLEVIGERWTLLIVRDAFYGVCRFSDFRDHLGIPRAVLAERLNLLVEHEIAGCGGALGADGLCQACAATPEPRELILGPRPQHPPGGDKPDLVSRALSVPHRLFDPVGGTRADPGRTRHQPARN